MTQCPTRLLPSPLPIPFSPTPLLEKSVAACKLVAGYNARWRRYLRNPIRAGPVARVLGMAVAGHVFCHNGYGSVSFTREFESRRQTQHSGTDDS